MTSAGNVTDDLCKVCDGRIECAPTAILLISLVHTLFGHIGPEPEYFRNKKDIVDAEEEPFDAAGKMQHKHKTRVHLDDSEVVEEYDFVVIGGGTAGCVVASRLSENRKWKVLLLEAGQKEPKMALIPALTSEFVGSGLDWQYSMRPKAGFCQNRAHEGCEIVQGRVLGGTSSINHLAYMRGNRVDYDTWALRGNEGWNYESVLPYFKLSEGNYDKDISKNKHYHSTQGPLDVGRYSYVDDNVDILLSAFNEMGYNYTDINGKNQIGFMRLQTMSYSGERVSSYTAFIEPIMKIRSNLDIETQALVTKLRFKPEIDSDNHLIKAAEVVYIKNGTRYKVSAKKEVILSAGAINSPKLLLHSGIGPRNYLEYINVKVYHDLPVGANFHDHLSVCLPVVKLSLTATTYKFQEKLKDITTYYSKGTGPLSANFQVVAFLESSLSEALSAPDIEIRFRGYNSNMYYDMMEMCVSLLTPRSRGHIMLNATNPVFGNPLIYPNFLKEPTDERKLLEGIHEIIKIFDTEVFKAAGIEFDPELILDNECKEHDQVNDDFWNCIIRHFSAPLHNYVGTCKMGPPGDPEAIVDNQLRLYGVSNVRIVDASIVPKIPRGSTAAPVLMIAEKASDMIKTTWY